VGHAMLPKKKKQEWVKGKLFNVYDIW